MKASELILDLPEENNKEREEKLIKFIESGLYIGPKLIKIKSEWNGHTATISVMSDALMIGQEDDFLRINATMEGEQKIANTLQLSMITPKIADLIYFNSDVQIEPSILTPDSKMSNTSRMIQHNDAVSNKIKEHFKNSITNEDIGCFKPGLVANVGKDWVLSNKLSGKRTLAANYGWHTKSKPNPKNPSSGPFRCRAGGYIWQNIGTRHDIKHVDYSQVVRLMSEDIVVDGKFVKFYDIALNQETYGLVNYDEPLTVLKHPVMMV
jgi:hypothetical protein